jgi:hypothetical protein
MKTSLQTLLAEAVASPHNELRQKLFGAVAEKAREELEELAISVKEVVLSLPPEELIGYLFCSQLRMVGTDESEETSDTEPADERNPAQVALEYVHAVLTCFDQKLGESPSLPFREEAAASLLTRDLASNRVADSCFRVRLNQVWI